MKINFKNENDYLKIEHVIGLFFLIRLIGITNPPLEIAHNWRQVTGLMVARNYLEIDPTFWFPRVDETNGLTGIIGMEFPLLNYLHYLVSLVFDYQHWYGRIINLIISSIGIYYFYRLVREKLNSKTAYFSTIFLLGSIWFIYSRKMMPDTFSMSIGFIGLYYCSQYLKNVSVKNFTLFFIFILLAFLTKISAVICIVGIPFLTYNIQSKKNKIIAYAATVIALIVCYLWYFSWNYHLADVYGSWYNSGSNIISGAKALTGDIGETFKRFYFSSFQSYFAFILLIYSIVIFVIRKQYKILFFLMVSMILFGLYMAKSGAIFYIHSYYIIPIVPVFAISIGHYVASIKNKYIALSIISLFLIESLANQQHDLFIKKSEEYKLTLEQLVSKHIGNDELVAVNGNGNPQELYLSHRKGFVLQNHELTNAEKMNSIKVKGCRYLIINRHTYHNSLNYQEIYNNKDYRIYKLAD